MRTRPRCAALASLAVVALLWEIAGRSGRWPLILAPISDIWARFVQLAGSGELLKHVVVSLNEFLVGFALAAVVGILLGIVIASSKAAKDFIDPWVSAVYATPTVALAPLFIFVFGIDAASKMAVVFLLAVFPIIINTATGITLHRPGLHRSGALVFGEPGADLLEGADSVGAAVHRGRAAAGHRPRAGGRGGRRIHRRTGGSRLPDLQVLAGIPDRRDVGRRVPARRHRA